MVFLILPSYIAPLIQTSCSTISSTPSSSILLFLPASLPFFCTPNTVRNLCPLVLLWGIKRISLLVLPHYQTLLMCDCKLALQYFRPMIDMWVSTFNLIFVKELPYSGWILIVPNSWLQFQVPIFFCLIVLDCVNISHFRCPLFSWEASKLLAVSGYWK